MIELAQFVNAKRRRRKMLAFEVLPNRPTGRKSVNKRTEPNLNSREVENEAVSNSLEREKVATPPLRLGSPTYEGTDGHWVQLASLVRVGLGCSSRISSLDQPVVQPSSDQVADQECPSFVGLPCLSGSVTTVSFSRLLETASFSYS
ncbi:hypothetical protein M9H77_11221 [Catharanthus roseus]|uniref:Uncharacterized protein n=1 Tax=Catharanthus roseus TaxID=4058 RepID=A0ACC0BE40_CATRO|nr:hypothetical protein M9H77_11221 [Catharanthus roseus]